MRNFNTFALGVTTLALTMAACFEPRDDGPPPFVGSNVAPWCDDLGTEVLLLVDTSARMGLPSGYKQGSKDISRADLVVDALKRTLPHVKKMVDFGLITFPFVDHRDGNPAPANACTVSDAMVEPRSPYGWIVSRLEHIQAGGKASTAGALMKAHAYFGANPANGRARAVVLFTAGGDDCGSDVLAAVEALATQGVTTVVISFENGSDRELLALAALRGGHLFRQSAHWGSVKFLSDRTSHNDLQAMLESADFAEICDGLDNDCDGLVDEDFDQDGDGWAHCIANEKDDDPLVYPGATDGAITAPYPPDTVIDWFQGPDTAGNPIDPVLSNPADALVNDPGNDGGHFSLGYYGFIEVAFACPVRNGPGADLRVIDGRMDDEWALETADVYAWSVADRGWVLLGAAHNQGGNPLADTVNEYDLGSLDWAARFRIVNTSPVNPLAPMADGFDVDGIYAMHDCAACDGIDNDNNGLVDDGFAIGENCTKTIGLCSSQGTYVCSEDGTHAVCEAPAIQIAEEVCNGLDDDCDGVIDNIEIACSTRCGSGIRTCTNGGWSECVITVPNIELCDGIDNDCDGQIDEDFPLGQDCRVGDDACGEIGYFVCSADKLGVQCLVTGTAPGSPEICDGIDNDCDGVIDNGSNLCPTGQVCFKGKCVYD